MRIAVVGLGLIGGSLGLASTARGHEVCGYDTDPDAVSMAVERGAVDRGAAGLPEVAEGADLALVCGPVAELPALVPAVLAAAPEGCAVSDVGSTKARLVDSIGNQPRFVGGHPVCGSEARGVANASADLFDGATYFLTPTAGTDPESHRRLHGFVATLGARPVAIDPQAHDRLVAITSHLPHAIANALVNQAGSSKVDGHDPLAAVGGSFRDMTRVAGANPRIWVDIFLDNSDALLDGLRDHGRRVDELTRALERGMQVFSRGGSARPPATAAGCWRPHTPPHPRSCSGCSVHVPDRPGVLAGITQALGADGINIEDFELHHLRPIAEARWCSRRRPGRGRPGGRAAGCPGLRRDVGAGGGGMTPALTPGRTPRGRPARCVGELAVHGDKSISHRAVMVGAWRRRGGGDAVSAPTPTRCHAAACRALGARVERPTRRRAARARLSACAACARRAGRSTCSTPAR